MSTAAQIAANRLNAENSTGPQTGTGKAASSQNNYRFGLTGNTFKVMSWERQEEYNSLRERFIGDLKPVTVTERLLIESITKHYWLVQRSILLQDLCLHPDKPETYDPKQLALFLRYQTTHQRSFDKTLDQYRQIQADRLKSTAEVSGQIGFESQKRVTAAEVRREAAEKRQQAAEIRREELHEVRLQLTKARISHYQAAASTRQGKGDSSEQPVAPPIELLPETNRIQTAA